MAKKRTARVAEVKKLLIEKIEEGYRRPGNWFISNRELANRYSISYQTAHVLISELCEEGYLHRTPSSGTYVASERHPPTGVALILHRTSQSQSETYGAILRRMLQARLEADGIDYEIHYKDEFTGYPQNRFCVIWGGHYDLHEISSEVHYSILIEATPTPGLNAIFTDSVSVDCFSAGAGAAQLLQKRGPFQSVGVLMGTEDVWPDLVRGFESVTVPAAVQYASGWSNHHFEEALARLEKEASFDALFCGNNAAAEVALEKLGRDFPIVAYGDEGRAVERGVTALTIPWDDMIEEVMAVFARRRMGDSAVARQRVLSPNLYLAPGWSR